MDEMTLEEKVTNESVLQKQNKSLLKDTTHGVSYGKT